MTSICASTLYKINVAIQKQERSIVSTSSVDMEFNPFKKNTKICQHLGDPSFNRCNFINKGWFLKFHLNTWREISLTSAKATKMILKKHFGPWYFDLFLQHDFWNVALQKHASRLHWPAADFFWENPPPSFVLTSSRLGGAAKKRGGVLGDTWKVWKKKGYGKGEIPNLAIIIFKILGSILGEMVRASNWRSKIPSLPTNEASFV